MLNMQLQCASTYLCPFKLAISLLICFILLPPLLMAVHGQAGPAGLSPQDLEALLQDFKSKDYYTAASIFSFLGASLLTPGVTMLIPTDKAIAEAMNQVRPATLVYPAILRYHMLERNLAFGQLERLPEGTWIPSLLPGYGVEVTKNEASNVRLNDAKIVTPDLCASLSSRALVSCQGIDRLLSVSSSIGREPQNPPLFFAPAPAPS